jgi:hypothetical protein
MMIIIFEKQGLKPYDENRTSLRRADLYLDCRVLLDNADEDMIQREQGHVLDLFTELVLEALRHIPERRRDRDRENVYIDPVRICCVCAWGIHRSRAARNILADRFHTDHALRKRIQKITHRSQIVIERQTLNGVGV